MKKIIGLFLLVLFALSMVYAVEDATATDTIWKGETRISFDKESFLDTEPVTGTVTLINNEIFPLVGGRVVLHVATGEYSYPSQFNNESNIVYETTISDIWVLPGDEKEISFSLPSQTGGEYRLDSYVWVMKSTLQGASSIFKGPRSEKFKIEGTEYQRASIFREVTSFDKKVGPVSFPVEPGEEFSGSVYIVNNSSKEKSGMKLKLSMCPWASAFCETSEEIVYDVPAIAPGAGQAMSVKLIAPQLSSAYEINMVLVSGEIIESIYKSRVTVSGGTSIIRRVYMDGLAEKDYSMKVLFAGSPDHFNYPDFENFKVNLELYSAGNMAEEQSVDIEKIATNQTLSKLFKLQSKIFDRACVKITKDSTVYEEECFPIELEKIQAAYDIAHPEEPKVEWNYNERRETLSYTISKKDLELDVRIFIIDVDTTVYEKVIKGTKAFSDDIYIKKDNYSMLVDDFTLAKQFSYDLLFNVNNSTEEVIGDVPSEFQGPIECNGTICGNGEVCSSVSYDSADGLCCTSTCIPATSANETSQLIIPALMWVALILLVIAAFVGAKAYGRVRK